MKRTGSTKGLVAGTCGALLISGAAVAADPAPMKSWINVYTHANQWQGSPHADIFGIIQPTYSYREGATVEDGFRFTRARLGVRGTVNPDISYWALYELARNGVTAPTNGGARLMDAQINWRFSDYANLRMGQFIPDFGVASTPGALVHWIDYTDIEKTVWFFNRNGDSQTNALREMGASLWNEFRDGRSSFTYEVGVYNGTGLNQVESTDDDRDVIASARYAYGPWWAHGGYWTGDREVSGQSLGKDKWTLSAGWGNYIKDKYWVMAEYLNAEQEQSSGGEIEADGFYAAAGWRPTKKVHLTYRYSDCDCEENVGPPGPRDSRVHSLVGEYFIKGNMKVMAQYDHRSDDLNAVANAEGDAFWLMFSMPFSYRVTP